MDEHHLPIRRTARYYTMEPTGAVRDVWFVLHGYGQLAAFFLKNFEALDDGQRLIVAPEALSRFYLPGHQRVGASWMTKEDRHTEIEDYLAYLDALYDHVLEDLDPDAVTVHVLGFSQGTDTASRWALLGYARVDHLVLWAGDLAHDLDLDAHRAALRRLGLTFVVGHSDEYLTPDRLAEHEARLRRHDVPYRLVPFDGGHHLDADVLRRLAVD